METLISQNAVLAVLGFVVSANSVFAQTTCEDKFRLAEFSYNRGFISQAIGTLF